MKPKETLYRLSKPGDSKTLKKIWAEHEAMFGKPKKLGWPTVVAERAGILLGFLSTDTSKKMLVAGPLILNGGSSTFTVLRLVEAYENVLRYTGTTNYYFHVDKTNERGLKMTRQLGMNEIDTSPTGFWFKRDLSQ